MSTCKQCVICLEYLKLQQVTVGIEIQYMRWLTFLYTHTLHSSGSTIECNSVHFSVSLLTFEPLAVTENSAQFRDIFISKATAKLEALKSRRTCSIMITRSQKKQKIREIKLRRLNVTSTNFCVFSVFVCA